MPLAAKEKILFAFPDPCVFFPACPEGTEWVAAFEGVAENSRQGFARKNPALYQGGAWTNSSSALGIREVLLETRVKSRCTGKERDAESGLDDFEARYYSSSLGRFISVDQVNITIDRMLIPQRLNLYSYVANNPLTYTDPTGKDLVAGSGDQAAIQAAVAEIASHPGGREFLEKLDNVTAEIKLSTGDLKDQGAYGKTSAQPGQDTAIQRTADGSDVLGPNIETTVDFVTAAADRGAGQQGAPESDAELLGHELAHDEAQFFKLKNTEKSADDRIKAILSTPVDKNLKKDAVKYAKETLKKKKKKDKKDDTPTPTSDLGPGDTAPSHHIDW